MTERSARAATAAGEQPHRYVRRRRRLDVANGASPTAQEFRQARTILTRSRVLSILVDKLDSPVGRPRSLSVEGLLVAMIINGLRRNHRATVIDVARILNAFSSSQLAATGVRRWDRVEAYDRTDRLFVKLSSALDDGWDANVDGIQTRIDGSWFANRIVQASLGDLRVRSRTLAVDGTDVQTWGALVGEIDEDDVDAVQDTAARPQAAANARRRRRARVLGVGPDGRKIYTADPDARAGWRTAVNSRPSGPYIGYELHLAVQARDVKASNGIDSISFRDEVPPVVRALALSPAGAHRGDAIVPALLVHGDATDLDDVIWDRGYSQLRPERAAHHLHAAGIEQTFRPMEHQRSTTPFSSHAVLIEGQLFSSHLPTELRGPLPMPPMGTSADQLERYERAFNRRARYRYQRHAGPDADGVTRWRCPFHSGFLRSRSLPHTMRASRAVPLVDLPQGAACCGGIISASARDLPLRQRLAPGTTAWRVSMGRRQVAEAANSGLKGGFVNIERKFLRIFGRTKVTVLLAFTVAGYNFDRIRSFLERTTEGASGPARRAKRRRGTFEELIGDARRRREHDPP